MRDTTTTINKTDMYRILTKDMLTPTICRMKVEAPRLARAAQPGQFLIIRADEQGERVPLTISDFDREEGSVTIVTQQIGASTSEICSYEAGDAFADVVGPLGIPSDFTEMPAEELAGKRYVFIAGGVGTAPVYPQVKWLHAHGAKVDVIIGAKTKDLVIYMPGGPTSSTPLGIRAPIAWNLAGSFKKSTISCSSAFSSSAPATSWNRT